MQRTEYVPLAEVKDGENTDFQEGVCHLMTSGQSFI